MHDITALRRAMEFHTVALKQETKPRKWAKARERRRAPRHDYVAEGTGTLVQREGEMPLDIAPNFPVVALTLSRTGTCFLANYEFLVGDVVELTYPAPKSDPKPLRARVVRCQRAGLRAYEIGAEFASDG